MPPLICTTNTWGYTDYGIPIIAKTPDYRTSTGNYHRHIPEKPQNFDCTVKARVRPDLLETDVTIRDDATKSLQGREYVKKGSTMDPISKYGRSKPLNETQYTRTVQEAIFKNPPPPRGTPLSEMKDNYRLKYAEYSVREIFPPELTAKCEIKGLGRDEQPAIRPEMPGFWKWLDPYMTTNRVMHPPYSKQQQEGIAQKDILTYYDILNYPKAKGFGPKNPPAVDPLVPRRPQQVFDKLIFKTNPSQRIVRILQPRVPNSGKTSEMKAKYTTQTYSDLFPFLHGDGVEFPIALTEADAWQNLPAPGMYCTETCHIGTGWRVLAVVDPGAPPKYFIHKPCYAKFQDHWQ